MGFLALGAILSVPLLSRASPVAETSSLSKRNPCDGVNASPILYHPYGEVDCPALNKLDTHGACSGPYTTYNNCGQYCQVNTTFTYTQEVPFVDTWCNGPTTCAISETKTVAFAINGGTSLTGKYSDAINIGVSGGWSTTWTTAKARTYTTKIDKGTCGYFTFVPVKKETCGTLTSAALVTGYQDIPPQPYKWCDSSRLNTTENVCASQVHKNPDGSPDGVTLFVYTDCVTREPITDPSIQDPVFLKPGVALDRGTIAAMIDSWPGVVSSSGPTPTATQYIEPWPSALAPHMGHGPVVIPRPGETIITLTRPPMATTVPTNIPAPSPSPSPSPVTTLGDTCDVSYRWLYDLVEIRGKAWTTIELGVNATNLKTQIAGCGAITDWNFELTPKDCCMDWYVSCHLPIGVKDCVGRAVETAGGPSAVVGDCHGAG